MRANDRRGALNCFVIMPFAGEFDDVYAAIKVNVEAVISPGGVCVRLDEARPAGRINDRLLREIEAAAICVVDVTGNNPNVMWELGYAMALKKPTILLTQDVAALPFDVRDLQTLPYDRKHVNRTLGASLQKAIRDTMATVNAEVKQGSGSGRQDELVGSLLLELKSMKDLLGDVVKVWGPDRAVTPSTVPLTSSVFEGAWHNPESHSNMYAGIVQNEVVVPYCYAGDRRLTGVYFGWRKTGEYWFGRFAWLDKSNSGFSFLKVETPDLISGAWWHDFKAGTTPSAPPREAGISARWERRRGKPFPEWATRFLDEVREEGLASRISRR
jgi:nucleoside 2-deoxyribosyltransferase